MIRYLPIVALVSLTATASRPSAVVQESLTVPGLASPVEIIKDRWGVSHIYAETEEDLFFAQGYNAARERLFQLEVWRRQAHGLVAELLGERELERDIGTRLFRFRGDMQAEMRHYHPRGDVIIPAFVRGVNAYIEMTERDPSLLPIEFELLNTTPGRWTPETVISRHQGLLGNIGAELNNGRAVARLGPDRVRDLSNFGPGDPDLTLDDAIDGELLFDDILARYNAFRRGIRFRPEDIVAAHRGTATSSGDANRADALALLTASEDIGSNNWVVSGDLSQSRFPMMANDPHRAQSAPSLRFLVHLVGPGWNVIGAGEPEIPGVSIGHNEYGAWGLTVFATDGEDLYVYDTNPSNPSQYWYQGTWTDMTVILDTIPVRGSAPRIVEHKYTRHGPVVYEDAEGDKAYAIRAAWMEIGGSPYLASLRMDQARTWEEFRDACSYSHIPGENMVWADRAGNIGWQAVGIAPVRPNWSGLVPVPGDGRYEWDGYLPIPEKPHVVNPTEGFFATANNDLIPRDYPHRNAVGWAWSDAFRWARISEVLGSGRRFSVSDMMELQTDELSIPARTLVPLLEFVRGPVDAVEQAREMLLDWEYVLDRRSAAAGLYVAWERQLQRAIIDALLTETDREVISRVSMTRVVDWLVTPAGAFGPDPIAGRDAFLVATLSDAVADLTERFGNDPEGWQYGRGGYKHALIRHPLSRAVNDAMRRRLDVGPHPRGGNSYTINNSGGGDNQTSGPSFRIIVDTEDWDRTVAANNPGQGGDPDDPHYRDLFDLWANDRYFPLYYSRDRVDEVMEGVVRLVPGG